MATSSEASNRCNVGDSGRRCQVTSKLRELGEGDIQDNAAIAHAPFFEVSRSSGGHHEFLRCVLQVVCLRAREGAGEGECVFRIGARIDGAAAYFLGGGCSFADTAKGRQLCTSYFRAFSGSSSAHADISPSVSK